MTFDCGDCHICEEEYYGAFFPTEEWKLRYFKGDVEKRDGVWFLVRCQYYIKERCTAHDAFFRPTVCRIYPCLITNEGEISVDTKVCPKAYLVDEYFISEVKKIIHSLGLTKDELAYYTRVINKYNFEEQHEQDSLECLLSRKETVKVWR